MSTVEQIIQLTFLPFDELPTRLESLGFQCQHFEGGISVQSNYLQIWILQNLNPTTRAAQLAFAFVGPNWAVELPTLLSEVKKAQGMRKEISV